MVESSASIIARSTLLAGGDIGGALACRSRSGRRQPCFPAIWELRPVKEGRSGPSLQENRDRAEAVGKVGKLPEEITPMQSSLTQALAALPWEDIEARIDASTEKNE